MKFQPADKTARGKLKPRKSLAAFGNRKKHRDVTRIVGRDYADMMLDWLKKQPDDGRLWRPLRYADLSLRFRRDMEAARKAWIAAAATHEEGHRRENSNTLKYVYFDGTRNVWADFHGLRHTGITFIERAKGLRVARKWADHSTPLLTAHYARR